ncbi:hypothetical protein [Pedobacter sp. UBA4863]|uniref:hypothetical protein n=1 Tax=Pedobacter sp. UBA4863 TaxID=1947060 RepID=UPI0025E3FC26|nr:hypothetical protein [Pedobacter sp. UBA4863]
MIVTSSGKLIAGNRIIINDTVNEFLGTVNNLWSNAANWSLGVVPTASHIAIIRANCNVSTYGSTCKELINNAKLNINNYFLVYHRLLNNNEIIGSVNSTAGSVQLLYLGMPENLMLGNANPINIELRLQSRSIDITSVIEDKRVVVLDINDAHIILNEGLIADVIRFRTANSSYTNETLTLGPNVTKIEATRAAEINSVLQLGAGYQGFIINLINLVEFIGTYVVLHRLSSNNSGKLKFTIIGTRFDCWYGTNLPQAEVNFNNANTIMYVAGNIPNVLGHLKLNGGTINYEKYNAEYQIVTINKISGSNSSSVFNNKSNLGYNGDDARLDIMPTSGIFNCNFDNSIVNYNKGGDQYIRIPDDINYRELRLTSSGIKKLTGNTICQHLYFSGTATLDLNGYTLTGYTKYTDSGTVNRDLPYGTFDTIFINRSGNKIFTGNIICNTFIYNYGIPINFNNFTLAALSLQITVDMSMGNHYLMPYDYDIMTFVYLGGSGGNNRILLTRNTTVNKIHCRGFKDHTNVFQVNETSFSIICSNWYFDGGEPQWVWSRTYENLTLSGTGQKYLQANIIVTGLYYRNPATILNKNGFTIKDASGNDLE